MHTLIDAHFNAVSARTRIILNEQREKLCRSLNTDLKAALRDYAYTASAVDAFRDKLVASTGTAAERLQGRPKTSAPPPAGRTRAPAAWGLAPAPS